MEYSLEQIKAAFIEVFYGQGELWLPDESIAPKEECEEAVESYWLELEMELAKKKLSPRDTSY